MTARRRVSSFARASTAALACAAVLVASRVPAQTRPDAAGDASCVSTSGRYRVSYTSELAPLAINRIHGWVLHVATAAGEPVTGASIEIDGGMPEHDHGLATRPRATAELGGGDYRVEGLRFHMPGRWEIVVSVRIGADSDRCTLSLVL